MTSLNIKNNVTVYVKLIKITGIVEIPYDE